MQLFDLLRQCHVLIVEDDPGLVPRLKWLFRELTGTAPTIVGSQEAGAKELYEHSERYGLYVVDVRLPTTEEDFEKNQSLHAEWYALAKEVASSPDAGESLEDPSLIGTRERLAAIEYEVESSLDLKAGINMIREWLAAERARRGIGWVPKAGVLFLSSRVHSSAKEEALALLPKSKWLTKPVTLEVVGNAARQLVTGEANQ